MTEFMRDLWVLLDKGPFGPIMAVIAVYAILFAWLMKNPFFRRSLERLARNIFYSERSEDGRYDTKAAIDEINRKLVAYEKFLQSKFDPNQILKIDEATAQFLEDGIKRKIEAEILQEKEIERLISRNIKSNLDDHIVDFLKRLTEKDVREIREQNAFLQSHKNASSSLDDVLEQQLRNTGRIKSIMINLFVVVNISVMVIYMTGLAKMSDSVAYSFLGIYVSLAAFIIYIYRSANFRSTVVIAIREDEKRYYDSLNYIARVCESRKLDEVDADILKLILTNRAEREKVARHPYEVVLKGISDSNVQLGGGKFAVGKVSKKE